jgi:hypothetical protein
MTMGRSRVSRKDRESRRLALRRYRRESWRSGAARGSAGGRWSRWGLSSSGYGSTRTSSLRWERRGVGWPGASAARRCASTSRRVCRRIVIRCGVGRSFSASPAPLGSCATRHLANQFRRNTAHAPNCGVSIGSLSITLGSLRFPDRFPHLTLCRNATDVWSSS